MAESDRGHGGGQRLHAVGDLAALTDEDLMLRYRDGEAAAFDVLVRRHRHRVLAFVRRIVKTPHHAEEVLGDVFLKLHRAAPRYQPTARFTTYLYTVAYRAALNASSKLRNQLDSSVGGASELDKHSCSAAAAARPTSSPSRTLDAQRTLAAVERELLHLPEAHRAAFVLYYRHGMSCGEVAECLAITPAEAKGRLAYARKLLRGRLHDLLRERKSTS